jgi:hypothetical protein
MPEFYLWADLVKPIIRSIQSLVNITKMMVPNAIHADINYRQIEIVGTTSIRYESIH